MSTISGAQVRSARALLGISAKQFADLSQVGWATIQRIEADDQVSANRAGTLAQLKSSLEELGIEFLGDPEKSPGVRLIRPKG